MVNSSSRVALVTGAAQGIGQAIAIGLARTGYHVVINDLTLSSLDDTRTAIEAEGQEALSCVADVSDREAVENMYARALTRFGAIDLVVSNVATNCRETVSEADWKQFRRVLEVNQMGLFHICQCAARQMQKQCQEGREPGNIVIISSVHARVPFAGNAAYGMSKAAAIHFTRVLAKELFHHRIRVNAVNPGWTDTPGERRYFTEEQLRTGGEALPLKRLASPDEIARAVLFLAGPEASYITGSVLDVDGGVHIAPEHVAPQG